MNRLLHRGKLIIVTMARCPAGVLRPGTRAATRASPDEPADLGISVQVTESKGDHHEPHPPCIRRPGPRRNLLGSGTVRSCQPGSRYEPPNPC